MQLILASLAWFCCISGPREKNPGLDVISREVKLYSQFLGLPISVSLLPLPRNFPSFALSCLTTSTSQIKMKKVNIKDLFPSVQFLSRLNCAGPAHILRQKHPLFLCYHVPKTRGKKISPSIMKKQHRLTGKNFSMQVPIPGLFSIL